jgi:transcription elongation factor Elf1
MNKPSDEIININEKMKVKAQTAERLLFYQYKCPFCDSLNVRSKDQKDEFVLCSDRGCRKMLRLMNIKDVA